MSLVEHYRQEAIARRRRFYGDEINYCVRKFTCSGGGTGRMWLGLDPECDFGSTARSAVSIVNAVLKVTRVSHVEFMGISRKKRIAQARQLACYFMRRHTSLSFNQISRYIAGRDHSTLHHGDHTVGVNHEGRFSRRICAIALELGLTPPVCE